MIVLLCIYLILNLYKCPDFISAYASHIISLTISRIILSEMPSPLGFQVYILLSEPNVLIFVLSKPQYSFLVYYCTVCMMPTSLEEKLEMAYKKFLFRALPSLA